LKKLGKASKCIDLLLSMVKAYLALGSNLGDKADYLKRAKGLLEASLGKVLLASSVIETLPWGVEDQDNYLNQVLCFSCEISPAELLDICQAIENSLGRKRDTKWGARTIDIDILLYGDQLVETESLQIPHPLMRERAFVLEPLLEIAPLLLDPISAKPYSYFLNQLLRS